MQTQTIKIELLINGNKVVVGHQFLEDIIRSIPDIKANKSIFDTLASSDNPDIRQNVAAGETLSYKTINSLLDDENQEVVDSVLANRDLAKYINEEALLKILDSGNVKFLCTIASNIENYIQCDACKIVKVLANHKNASVKYSLLRWRSSEFVSARILKQLSKDKDIDVAKEAQAELDNIN